MKRIVVLIALLALVFGGVAYATIPDSSGVIHGCYSNVTNGTLRYLRVIDSPTQVCRSDETAINWNQAGTPGATGATGATGAIGAAGASGTNGVSGYERVAVQQSCTPAQNQNCVARIACPVGKEVLGGGFSVNAPDGSQLSADNNIYVQSASPVTDTDFAVNTIERTSGAGGYLVTAYAVCAVV
jgi:hypothetical protein